MVLAYPGASAGQLAGRSLGQEPPSEHAAASTRRPDTHASIRIPSPCPDQRRGAPQTRRLVLPSPRPRRVAEDGPLEAPGVVERNPARDPEPEQRAAAVRHRHAVAPRRELA